MRTPIVVLVFMVAASVSLATSWALVSRIERIGFRFGLSEALLGVVAALAADSPEVTSAVTAMIHHHTAVGAGVVIGSNVFNLAALLGLSAIVAGSIAFHRRVVLFSGTVAVWIALVCLATVSGLVNAPGGLALSLLILVPYLVLLGLGVNRDRHLALPASWRTWLAAAVRDEEHEVTNALDESPSERADAVVAVLSLIVVIVASIVMEQSATSLGKHFNVPDIIVGGIVLAAVTSLPNAVAAVYLASRKRGAAVLSTALNSNALNVVVGLLLPATIMGAKAASHSGVMVAVWYVGLTVLSLGIAYWERGLRRSIGVLIVMAYAGFVAMLLLA